MSAIIAQRPGVRSYERPEIAAATDGDAVSAPPASPVTAARTALADAQDELLALDQRIIGYEREQEDIAAQQLEHKKNIIRAVSRNQPVPKPPKIKPTDGDVAVPILRAQRPKLAERVAEAQGNLRLALVLEVKRRYLLAENTYADAAAMLIEAWRELIGLHALLMQAGVTSYVLPPALFNDFSIPAVGKLRPLAPQHHLHFFAGHELALGADGRAAWAARKQLEGEVGVLPW